MSEKDLREKLPTIKACKLEKPHFGPREWANAELDYCPICRVESFAVNLTETYMLKKGR